MSTLLQATGGSARRGNGHNADEAVVSLIEAAKKMQARRIRRILAEMQNSVDESSAGVTSLPPLGLGRGSGLDAAACFGNAVSRSTDLARNNIGVNGHDDKGRTALHFSSGMASPECALILLEAGADPNACDHDGFTPLHMAAGYGRGQCIDVLLKHGTNPFIKDKAGRTARELAVEINNGTMRSQDGSLVPRGDMDETITLLANAEWKEHLSSRDKLRATNGEHQQSIAVDASTRAPYEELISMAASGDLAGVSSVLEKFPDTADALWQTSRAATLGNALSAACRAGHLAVGNLLLNSGASVDAHDGDGATPLLAAADSGYASCVKLLLEAGAQPDEQDRVGVTALIAAAYNGHADCLEVLLSSGAVVDARSHGGVTPLIAAAEGRHASCIDILLKAGADADAKTSEGKTALMHAVGRDALEATRSLLDGGASVDAVDLDGCSSLHHGARNDASDCLVLLCDRGADVTRRCRRGRTAHMEAPQGSAASAVLEARWIALEAEVARRQAELLSLFEQESGENISAVVPKGSSQRSKDKRRDRKKKDASLKEARSRKTTAASPSIETSLAQTNTSIETSILPTSSALTESLPSEPEQAFDSEDIFEIMAVSSGRSHEGQEGTTEAKKAMTSGAPEAASADSSSAMDSKPVPSEHSLREEDDDWIRVDSKGLRSHSGSHRAIRRVASSGEELTRKQEIVPDKEVEVRLASGPKRKKGTGNKQPKKNEDAGRVTDRVEKDATQSSPWVRAVLQTKAGTARSHYTAEKPDVGEVMMVDMKKLMVLCQAEKELEVENGVIRDVQGEFCDPMDAAKGEEQAVSAKLAQLEEELRKESKLLEIERAKVTDLEKAFQEERARAERANLELLQLQEAMAAQEVARLEVERERGQLERKLQDLQRMNAKRAFLEERGTSKRGPGSAIGRAHTAAGIISEDLTVRRNWSEAAADSSADKGASKSADRMRSLDNRDICSTAAAAASGPASWKAWEAQRQLTYASSSSSTSDDELHPLKAMPRLPPLPVRSPFKGGAKGYPVRHHPDCTVEAAAAAAAAVAAATVLHHRTCPRCEALDNDAAHYLATNRMRPVLPGLQAPPLDYCVIPASNPYPCEFPEVSNVSASLPSPTLPVFASPTLPVFSSPTLPVFSSPMAVLQFPLPIPAMQAPQGWTSPAMRYGGSYTSPVMPAKLPKLQQQHSHSGFFRRTDSVPDFRMFGVADDADIQVPVDRSGHFGANQAPATDLLRRSGLRKFGAAGMSRSASEGCLNLMGLEGGNLPFAPKPGQKPNDNGGWFSLVPSPSDDEG